MTVISGFQDKESASLITQAVLPLLNFNYFLVTWGRVYLTLLIGRNINGVTIQLPS